LIKIHLSDIVQIVEEIHMEQILVRKQDGSSPLDQRSTEENDLQICNIIAGALKRADEAVRFFEINGVTSKRMLNRAFFMYLNVKKDAQRKMLGRIASSLGIELSLSFEPINPDSKYESYQEEYGNIFKIIQEITSDELEFYLNYAAVERDQKVKNLILLLADFSKEFLFDVKIWYLNHKECPCIQNAELKTQPPAYMVETVLN
jgi:hypothetical protein